MKAPEKCNRVVNGKRYNIETATLLAGDDWWDGNNHERSGTNTWLYRTPRGNFFTVTRSQWQGSPALSLESLSQDKAISFYETCAMHGEEECDFEAAFPGVTIEDA